MDDVCPPYPAPSLGEPVVTSASPAITMQAPVTSEPGVWDILSSIGAFAAAVVALVAVVVTLRQIRIEARRFAKAQEAEAQRFERAREIEAQRLLKAQEDATAESGRLYELGVLRELLDSVPADEEDAELERHGHVMVITHRHYQLLSLLPGSALPFWRRLAVAVGRGHGDREILRICDDAGAPPTFSIRRRVRRVQQRELLEAIQERTGGSVTGVAAWFERLDGRSR